MTTRGGIFLSLKIIAAAGLLGAAIVAPNALQGLDVLLGKGKHPRNNNQRILNELKRQKLIVIDSKDSDHHFKLTKRGSARLAELEIEDLSIPLPKKWDNLWRIIAFDIPVEKSASRVKFTKKLAKHGFFMHQRSMWVHYASCFEQVRVLTDYYGLTEYCSFIEVSSFDHSTFRRLKNHFRM